MKTFVFAILCIFVIKLPTNAQYLAPDTHLYSVLPYKIQVSNNVTTVIAFPYTVVNADCGTGELRAEKVAGMENVLKIKAVSPNMDTTNLHVFTADGKIHVFLVIWNASPALTTYDLRDNRPDLAASSPNRYTTAINEKELNILVKTIRNQKGFLHRNRKRFQLKLSLLGIYTHNNILFIKFNVRNRSRLSYDAGWASLYIQDKKIARRSSIQQIPIVPVYMDELPFVDGNNQQQWVIAVPRITIPDKKQLTFELQEHNGGRHITITIRNKDLFKAKAI
jgi:Bacteroides conjugative transposon TraN protein